MSTCVEHMMVICSFRCKMDGCLWMVFGRETKAVNQCEKHTSCLYQDVPSLKHD